jgi:hypothetical protein
MSPLPDRTLCWVQGPPWDRTCEPVEHPTIEIGIPGHSDLVLYELENAAKHLGCTVAEAAVLMVGMGLAAAQEQGLFQRASEPGAGFDPDWRPPTEGAT